MDFWDTVGIHPFVATSNQTRDIISRINNLDHSLERNNFSEHTQKLCMYI